MTEEKSQNNKIQEFRSAFVALIGRPNCGKSTLLNTVLGEGIAIVTPLPQTTRTVFRGIYNAEDVQIVFVDTPGIHRGKHKINKAMYEQSASFLSGDSADIICYMVDMSRQAGEEEDAIAAMVSAAKSPVVIVFNKKDACRDAPAFRESFLERYPNLKQHKAVTISAKESSSKKVVLDAIMPMVKPGPRFFPEDDLTDSGMRFLAAEFIRKRIIENSREEVPHAVCVEILKYEELPDRHYIDANIHVETDGQKAIVIGARGSLVTKIQKLAGEDIAAMAGVPVSVKCHVKVTPHWRDNQQFLREMGIGRKS
jgi:GTP-binding protein Era